MLFFCVPSRGDFKKNRFSNTLLSRVEFELWVSAVFGGKFLTQKGLETKKCRSKTARLPENRRNIMRYYLEILKKFNNFHDKASYSEFSRFILVHSAIICVLLVLGYLDHALVKKVVDTLTGLFLVGTSLPCVALFVRRLNTLGRNPKLVAVGLIPVVGLAYLLFICLKKD